MHLIHTYVICMFMFFFDNRIKVQFRKVHNKGDIFKL